MKPVIVAFLLVAGLWAGEGFGQVDTVWLHNYGNQLFSEYGKYIIDNNDDRGFILVGDRYNEVHHTIELLLIKVDSVGQQSWMRSLHPVEQNWRSIGVISVDDNQILLVGHTEYRPFILITTVEGDIINSIFLDSGRVISAVTLDHSVYVVSITPQNQLQAEICDLISDSCSTLQIRWPNDRPLCEFRLMFTNGNDLFMCFKMGWGDPEAPEDIFVIYRLNGDGSLSATYSTVGIPKGVFSNINGEVFLVGDRPVIGSGQNIFVSKLNSEFNELWTSTYGGEKNEGYVNVMEQNDGSLIVLTYDEGSGGLLKLDQDGDSLWMCDLGLSEYFPNYRNMRAVDNNEILIIGDQSDGEGNTDMFLLKVASDDLMVKTSDLYSPECLMLSTYPNPFNSTLNIGFSCPMNREAIHMFVVDPLGRRIADLIPNVRLGGPTYAGEQRVVWNAEGLPAGKYVIYLEAGTTRSAKAVTLLK